MKKPSRFRLPFILIDNISFLRKFLFDDANNFLPFFSSNSAKFCCKHPNYTSFQTSPFSATDIVGPHNTLPSTPFLLQVL